MLVSFPRTVFVTVATPDEPFHSQVILSSPDVFGGAGATVEVPLFVYTADFPIRAVRLEFSARKRISGVGRERPSLSADSFLPHLDLPTPSVTQHRGRGGFTTAVDVAWEAAPARQGGIELGVLRVTLPAETALGSAFLIESRGEVIGPGGEAVPINGVPAIIRVWGGPEPTAVHIDGPSTLGEDGDAVFRVTVEGLSRRPTNVGWWVERVSGRASIAQDIADRTNATVRGERAGFVKVMAVVGTHVAELLVRVVPPTEGRTLSGIALRNLMPSLTRQVIEHRHARAVKLLRGSRRKNSSPES